MHLKLKTKPVSISILNACFILLFPVIAGLFSSVSGNTPQVETSKQEIKSMLDTVQHLQNLSPENCIAFIDQELSQVKFPDSVVDELMLCKARAYSLISLHDSTMAVLLGIERRYENAGAPDKTIGDLLNETGKVYARVGDFEKAALQFNALLEFARENHDSILMAKAFNNLGNIASRTRDFQQALDYYTKSLSIKQLMNDTITMSSTLINLGNVSGTLGKLNLAMDYFGRALKFVDPENDTYNYMGILLNMGANYLDLEQYDEAEKSFDSTLKMATDCGYSDVMPGIYQNLAELHRLRGNDKEALKYTLMHYRMLDSLGNNEMKHRINMLESQLKEEKNKAKIHRLNLEIKQSELKYAKQQFKLTFIILSSIILILITLYLISSIEPGKGRDDSRPCWIKWIKSNRYCKWLIIAAGSIYFILFFHLFGSVSPFNSFWRSALFSFAIAIIIFVFISMGYSLYRSTLKFPALISGLISLFIFFAGVFAVAWLISTFGGKPGADFQFRDLFTDIMAASVIPLASIVTWHIERKIARSKMYIKTLNEELQLLNAEINQQKADEQILHLSGKNKNELLKIRVGDFVYAKSEDNYIRIFYLQDDIMSSILFRNTLAKIEEQLSSAPSIFRCHRSYLINSIHIAEIKGNAKRTLAVLNVKNTPDIPYSLKKPGKYE